ncbi:hypothetical protein [Phytoactinopolyspora halophila]|uniref:hypothetical protein n=1 Tax=Phytoactinopolyspora halophila TaxID=1981511 RepID=UPI00131482A3|nr:hypothetical protein [Phytoactinopolyspora halophila]
MASISWTTGRLAAAVRMTGRPTPTAGLGVAVEQPCVQLLAAGAEAVLRAVIGTRNEVFVADRARVLTSRPAQR